MLIIAKNRLLDIIHHGNDLFLVLEYLDHDLKHHMDALREKGIPCLSSSVVKVHFFCHRIILCK
jgi:hypothetical protein